MARESEHTYPPELATPAAARSFVGDYLEAWGRTDLVELACLLTSELVTNAVVHAQSEMRIRVTLDERVLRVEIEDGDPAMRRPRWIQDLTDRGRGLQIVESLSLSWGVRPRRNGKVVWFDLDASGLVGDESIQSA